jgi:pyruvate,orthophosphate dikinase
MPRPFPQLARYARSAAGAWGAKAATLGRMAVAGLPVPLGVVIPADLADWQRPLRQQCERWAARLPQPVLWAVRCSPPRPQPGLMPAILNIGLGDQRAEALIEAGHPPAFIYDCYGRLIASFGQAAAGLSPADFKAEIRNVLADTPGGADSPDLYRRCVRAFKLLWETRAGRPWPEDPWEQLEQAVAAARASWHSDVAVAHRRRAGLPAGEGTAVIVQVMVFGNRDPASRGHAARSPGRPRALSAARMTPCLSSDSSGSGHRPGTGCWSCGRPPKRCMPTRASWISCSMRAASGCSTGAR